MIVCFFFFLEFSSFDRKFYFVLSAVYCIRSVNYFCQVYNVVRSLDELGDRLARLYIKINDRDTFFFLSFFRIINLFQYLKRSSATWYFSRSRSFTFVSRFIFLSISLSTLMIEINYIYTIEGGLYSLIIDYFKRKVTFFFFLISMKFGQVNRHNGRRYPRGNGRIVRNKLS